MTFRKSTSGSIAATCAIAALLFAPSALAANDTTQFSVTAGALSLGTAPDVPNLSALTLNGQAQTLTVHWGPGRRPATALPACRSACPPRSGH